MRLPRAEYVWLFFVAMALIGWIGKLVVLIVSWL